MTSTIDRLPNELLLEIFDAYRQHFRGHDADYEMHWNRKLAWFKLTHVCRKWRCVMFASSSRLDLCLVLTLRHGGHMKTIMSSRLPPLPIVIDYYDCCPTPKDVSRLLSALRRNDRVRKIVLIGEEPEFAKFFKETKRSFPILESLQLRRRHDHTLELPTKFLGGSTPHLQCLNMDSVLFDSIAQILSSATALVELSLGLDTAFGKSSEDSLLAYLQAMPCLRHLQLRISRKSIDGLVHSTNPEDVVLLSKLMNFRYYGPSVALNALIGGLEAPYLHGLCIMLDDWVASPISHLARFVDDVDKKFHSVQLAFGGAKSRISLLTKSKPINLKEPPFTFHSLCQQDLIMGMSNELSAKLATVKELLVAFELDRDTPLHDDDMWRSFLQLFPSVKVIRLERDAVLTIADSLRPTDGGSELDPQNILPSLKEIELRDDNHTIQNARKGELEEELAAFQPFASARAKARRPIKIYRSVTALTSLKSLESWQNE